MKLLLVTKRISQAYTIFLGLVNVGWNQWASSFLCCPQVQARPKLCPRCPCPQVNGRPNHCTGAYLQGRPDLCPGPQWRPNTWPCERNDELASHWCCWHLGWCCWPWEWNQEWNQGLSMIQNGPDEVSGAWGIVRQLLWQQDIPFVVPLRFVVPWGELLQQVCVRACWMACRGKTNEMRRNPTRQIGRGSVAIGTVEAAAEGMGGEWFRVLIEIASTSGEDFDVSRWQAAKFGGGRKW